MTPPAAMGWSVWRLRDCVRLTNGYPFDSSLFSKDEGAGLRIVRIRDLLSDEDPIYYAGADGLSVRISNGDLVIGMDGDFNVVQWNRGSALLNQRLCTLRERSAIDRRFLFYLLPSPLREINDLTYFTTVKHLASGDVLRIRVRLPPIHHQRTIVSFLDRKTAAIDALIAKKERLIELLQEKRQALITQAVTKGLDPNVPMKDSGVPWIGTIPRHWRIAPLRGVLRHRGEYNTRLQTTNVLSVVKDVGVIPYAERAASGNKHSEDISKYKVIHPGDLVMNRMNIIIGSVGVSRYHGASSIEYYVLRPASGDVSTEFFGNVFTCRGFQISLVGIGTGILSHRLRISTEEMNKLLLPLPPRAEQDAISRWIVDRTQREVLMVTKLRQAVDLLREYRQALITAAVTGKIDLSNEAA